MLFGRGDDCAELTDIVVAAQRGASRAMVIRGEAGVGKTALLDWLSHESAQRAMAQLRCAGVESEADLPFAGLHQLLRPAIHAMPALPRLQQEALNGALGLSGRRGVDPFLVAVAALSLLGELAADTGVICIVDDAQWLDPSSADVLRFVARRLDAEGIVLVFAVRDPDPSVFEAAGLTERQLRGLDADAAASLLLDRAPMVTDEVRDRLVAHHAGNPLAIIELAPLLTDEQLAGTAPLPDPLPMGGEVERLYAARASALSEDGQALLLLAATADTDDLGLVLDASAALDIDPASMAEAESSGLVTAARGVVRFRHPLVRSAIYQQSSFRDRQRGHAAMAALLTHEADADRRAWHLVRSATGFDDVLADLLEESADRALARGGPASATDRWQWSAEFSTDHEVRFRRFLRGAETALMAAQPTRAGSLLSLAEPLATTSLERGRVHALRGMLEMRHGIPDTAYHLLVDAAADLSAEDPVAALESLVMAGEAATLLGDPRLTSEVGAIAGGLRGPDTGAADQSMIDLLVGLGKLFEGNWYDGSRVLAQVLDEQVVGDDFGHVLRSGRAAMYLGRLPEARALYAKAVVTARGTAAPGQLTPMLDRLAYIEMLLGRLADAEAHALEGLRLAGDVGLDAGIAVSSLAMVHAYRGEEAECRELAATALEVAQTRQLKMIGAAARWALGVLDLAGGRPADALEQMLTIASDAQGHPGILRWATPDLVEAAARSGRPEACAPAVARLEAWATASGLPVPAAELHRCRGLLASGEQAVDHFEAALLSDEQDSRPLERARTQLLLGETLRRARRRSDARSASGRAWRPSSGSEMRPWAERARNELRACGESVAKRDPSDAEHLTPQELQIAQYAAGGESNADIAAKLFLSRRTVEYHLAKVYTKTGVTSRRELAGSALLGS